jgi:hypothetical protein
VEPAGVWRGQEELDVPALAARTGAKDAALRTPDEQRCRLGVNTQDESVANVAVDRVGLEELGRGAARASELMARVVVHRVNSVSVSPGRK